jgi:hypothetical protein
MLLDLSTELTASATVDDPEAVTLAAPVDSRGQLTVTPASGPYQVHTFRVDESPRAFPADWFQVGDDVDAERFDE